MVSFESQHPRGHHTNPGSCSEKLSIPPEVALASAPQPAAYDYADERQGHRPGEYVSRVDALDTGDTFPSDVHSMLSNYMVSQGPQVQETTIAIRVTCGPNHSIWRQ